MPDLVMHHYLANSVYESLPHEMREKISNRNLFCFTSAGPDPFFFYKFLDKEENKRVASIGHFMHENMIHEFFMQLAEKMKTTKHPTILFSYLTGFLTHHALDSKVHPYVFYKTGVYQHKNPETYVYRGLHTKIERAMDVAIIEQEYQKKAHRLKIHKDILKLKALPIEIKSEIDDVYKELFGLEDAFYIINGTIVDQKKFYQFIYDPCGVKNIAFRLLDNKKKETSYRYFSYYGRKCKGVDIFNEQKQQWTNPADETLVSTKSVYELIEIARAEAVARISKLYRYFFQTEEQDLAELLPQTSYLTGLKEKKVMQYFDSIFK